MSVNLVGGVDYNQWLQSSSNIESVEDSSSNSIYDDTIIEEESTDSYVSVSGETCTDGKDDGKIGFFSAIGNALKGVGQTIVNGIKGMFTDSEGNFSLGKTLLSIGTVAACIAFPAVGIAACAIGGTMGAIQVGKGIYKAATAETDAEAKVAWQNIGGGVFTVATSAAGAKAGLNAVKATSTAGAGGTSALSQLDDAASIGQKASALGKDMLSSTANRASNIKTGAKNIFSNTKSAMSDIKSAYSETSVAKAKAALKAAKESGNADDIAAAEAALKQARTQANAASKELWNEVKTSAKAKGSELWSSIKGKITKDNASQVWESLKTNAKNFNLKNMGSKLSGTSKSIYSELTSGTSTYAQVVQKYGFDNVAQVLQYVAGIVYADQEEM